MTLIYGNQFQLERKKLIFEYKKEGFYKAVTDLQVYKNYLFIVDFQYNQVLEYKHKDSAEFIRLIGKKGQGPGDIQKPFSISIDNDIISIIDQTAVSFFDLNGIYINKFRLFSNFIDSIFINKLFFHLNTNPKNDNLIEVYTIDGKRIMTFGKKYLKLNYKVRKGLPAALIERTIYDGELLSDGNFIYYINRRFGTLHKYSLSGKMILQKDLLSLFGENEKRKADKNRNLFLENEYVLTKENRSIRRYDIFLEAKLLGDKIYFLLDQHNILKNKPKFSIEIISINKGNFNVISKYQTPLLKGEWIRNFTVKMEEGMLIFLVDISSKEEGVNIYEFRPTEIMKYK
jgi:hypothetical protein